ncbi:hypothetical protein [Mesorhizobium sp. C280B]|uniref:serine O-acetyltransferase n=1 Tax=Mesorhizobium sp. C280B TaxID=2956828 RepID=UPI000A052CD3
MPFSSATKRSPRASNRTLSRLRAYIRADFRMRKIAPSARAFAYNPIVRFTVLLRLNEYLANREASFLLRALPYFWYRRLAIRLGFTVPLNVFGPGLAIVHYGLLVVTDKAIIGRNCRIHMGAHIGGASTGYPVIGNNCYIAPGAKIFGGIKIGSCCRIGANAVVNKSFPSNVTIVGVPAKISSGAGNVMDQAGV